MEQGNSHTYLKFWKETNSYLFLSQKHLNKYKYVEIFISPSPIIGSWNDKIFVRELFFLHFLIKAFFLF